MKTNFFMLFIKALFLGLFMLCAGQIQGQSYTADEFIINSGGKFQKGDTNGDLSLRLNRVNQKLQFKAEGSTFWAAQFTEVAALIPVFWSPLPTGRLAAKNTLQLAVGEEAAFDGHDGTVKMAILENGNVGIGTTSPQAKLDIVGTLQSKFTINNEEVIFRLNESHYPNKNKIRTSVTNRLKNRHKTMYSF